MGSSQTVEQAAGDGHLPSQQAARDAEEAFDQLNRPFLVAYNVRVDQRQAVRAYEDGEARGWRARLAEGNENSGPDQRHQYAIQRRGDHGQDLAWERAARQRAEQAFDRLNPEFGVAADTRDRYGVKAMRDREAALSLGTRVAVATSRENDRDPVMWVAGQDYRAADAIHRARTETIHVRRPAERAGAER